MLKLSVWVNEKDGCYEIETNKHPRRYMTSWSFDRMLKYVKDDIEWYIDLTNVVGFSICESGYWRVNINKEI